MMNFQATVVAIATICTVSTSLSPAAEKTPIEARNPALSYWQAAAQLPELTNAQAKQLQALADGKVEFHAPTWDGLDFAATAAFLRKAAASSADCDWGLSWEDGPEMRVPHLAKVRELSTVVLMLAEGHFAKGETRTGIELLEVAHHVARDADTGSMLIATIVQDLLERQTIRLAARHCMHWKTDDREFYAERLGALPDLRPLHEGFAGESILADWFEQELEKDVKGAAQHFGLDLDGPLKDPKSLQELIDEQRQMLARTDAALKLQGEERRRAAADLRNQIKNSKNPVVRMLMPDVTRMIRAEDETLALQAMLKLALKHGPEISPETLEGTPFTVARKDGKPVSISNPDGFTLQLGGSQ